MKKLLGILLALLMLLPLTVFAQETGTIKGKDVRVRTGPGTSYDQFEIDGVKQFYEDGQKVVILATEKDKNKADWYRVSAVFNGITYDNVYVKASYVVIDEKPPLQFAYNGKTYMPQSLKGAKLDGYDVKIISIEDYEVEAFVSGKFSVLLLSDGLTESLWFYENGNITPYYTFSPTHQYRFSHDLDNEKLNMNETETTICGNKVKAWGTDDPNIVLIYLENEKGEKNFYSYDLTEHTISKYVEQKSGTWPTGAKIAFGVAALMAVFTTILSVWLMLTALRKRDIESEAVHKEFVRQFKHAKIFNDDDYKNMQSILDEVRDNPDNESVKGPMGE